jgi:hypothetical protein
LSALALDPSVKALERDTAQKHCYVHINSSRCSRRVGLGAASIVEKRERLIIEAVAIDVPNRRGNHLFGRLTTAKLPIDLSCLSCMRQVSALTNQRTSLRSEQHIRVFLVNFPTVLTLLD